VIFPTLYLLRQAVLMLRSTQKSAYAWSALLNPAVILFLPFSTFREPLGLVRIFTGVVLSFVFLNAQVGNKRNQNIAYFWIALLALLVNQ
jgi:hypothetical protein